MMNFPDKLYGESVFTTTLCTRGALLFEREHFSRLIYSVESYYLDTKLSEHQVEFLKSSFKDLIPQGFDGAVRLNIKAPPRDSLLATSLKFEDLIFEVFVRSITDTLSLNLKTFESPFSSAYPDIKMGSYMPHLYFKRKAISEGFDEALFVSNKRVVSCSTSNIFFVKNGQLYTPQEKVLSGIIQGFLIRENEAQTISITESDMSSFESAFVTNSAQIIKPVERINDIKYIINNELVENLKNKILKSGHE